MTITALITGTLVSEPQVRTSGATGKPFTVARMAAGTDDDSVLVSLVAFGSTGQQLAELVKGDSLAVSGRGKPTTWKDREGAQRAGLDVVADQLLTVYHVRKRRQAMAPTEEPSP